MKIRQALSSEQTAWIAGGLLVSVICAAALWLVGWIGLGLVGLAGLIVSSRVGLHGGHALVESGHGSSDVPALVRQIEAARAAAASPEQRMRAAEEHEKRSRTLSLLNTLFGAIAALGLGLFVLHDLL